MTLLSALQYSSVLSTKLRGPSVDRAANGIFAKVGRLASEEVTGQLLKQKCLPISLYATWTKDQCSHWTLHSIDCL